MLIDHPEYFMSGTRVIQLTGRNKDNAAPRRIHKVSTNQECFEEILEELIEMARPNERIYASASARNVERASRDFKHRMVDAETEPNPMSFYESLNSRWVSCLMAPNCQSPKLWMFDCDSVQEYASVLAYLNEQEKSVEYQYKTKNGYHVIVTPFHMRSPSPIEKQDNPLILWMY